MRYQVATRKESEISVGIDESAVAEFGKAGFFVRNLKGSYQGVEYEMKLPAPWTGNRYWLRQGGADLASAKRTNELRAPDPDRPFSRENYVDFHLEVNGRSLVMRPDDHHGLVYRLLDGELEVGRFEMRSFGREDQWTGDVELPDDWGVSHAAFVAWLAWEGRDGMRS